MTVRGFTNSRKCPRTDAQFVQNERFSGNFTLVFVKGTVDNTLDAVHSVKKRGTL